MMTKSCHYTAEISQNYEVSGPVSRSFFTLLLPGASVFHNHILLFCINICITSLKFLFPRVKMWKKKK